MIGAVVLISSGYSRSGFFLRIAAGVGLMVLINALRGVAQSWVAGSPDSWFLLYVPVLVASAVVFALVRSAMANFRRKRRSAGGIAT